MATESQVAEYIEGRLELDEYDEQTGRRTLASEDSNDNLPSPEHMAEVFHTRMLRQVLVAEGPALIPMVVAASRRSIKDVGKYLTTPIVGMQAARKVDHRMVHAEQLVKAIALASREWGTQVGARLVQSLGDRDADVRVLAALMCGADGIPPRAYGQQVVERFQLDRDSLVRLAAAICMATVPDAPLNVVHESVGMVMTFLQETAIPAFPDLVRQVRRELRNQDEGVQNLMIAKAAVYRVVASR